MADWSKAKVLRGKISESDRSFDYDFWRAQSPATKMATIWETVLLDQKVKNRELNEIRLD